MQLWSTYSLVQVILHRHHHHTSGMSKPKKKKQQNFPDRGDGKNMILTKKFEAEAKIVTTGGEKKNGQELG